MRTRKLGDGTPAPTVPTPVADARPAYPAAQSRAVPGGHPYLVPAAAPPRSAAGARFCRYCRGSGVLLGITVGSGGALLEDGGEPVWCVCEWGRRVQLVHAAVQGYVDEHGFAPTVRDLVRSTLLPLHATRAVVDRLQAAGLVEVRKRNARCLRIIPGGRS